MDNCVTPIIGSASCTRRQQPQSDDEDLVDLEVANLTDNATEDSHGHDDLMLPPPPSPPCTCGKNLELPPTPPLEDVEAAAASGKNPFAGKPISSSWEPFTFLNEMHLHLYSISSNISDWQIS